jgi:hypothetical protein
MKITANFFSLFIISIEFYSLLRSYWTKFLFKRADNICYSNLLCFIAKKHVHREIKLYEN